jgi:hypothetical protein
MVHATKAKAVNFAGFFAISAQSRAEPEIAEV